MTLESHPGKPLIEHLEEVASLAVQMLPELDSHILSGDKVRQLARLIGSGHDLGKASLYFQDKLRNRPVSRKALSEHALLSAMMVFWLVYQKFKDEEENERLLAMLLALLSVKRHHSNMEDLTSETSFPYDEQAMATIEAQLLSIPEEDFNLLLGKLGLESSLNRLKNKILDTNSLRKIIFETDDAVRKLNSLEAYLLTNLLWGLLVDADIRAVMGLKPAPRQEIPFDIVRKYVDSMARRNAGSMNSYRNKFFQEVDRMARNISLEQKILSITAPTGIGKTLAGLNAALVLRQRIYQETGRRPRIIYALPFTSIIDQNHEVFQDVFRTQELNPDDYIVKHHHLAEPPNISEHAKAEDYERASTAVETWDSELIITTFVQVFETLFTNKRSKLRKLHRLAGSILILDEVQNIPPRFWRVTEEVLTEMARLFDTRTILMTATRPALLEGSTKEMFPGGKQMFEQLKRTELLIKTGEDKPYSEIEDWLMPEIKGSSSFLVIMNTIRSSQEVYHALEHTVGHEYNMRYLSASLIPLQRKERIQEIKSLLEQGQKIGVVSTQTIEAGVDLEFDVVIRDIAPMDSVIQAAGRCNRNMSIKKGRVVLVKLRDEDKCLYCYIYDRILISATKEAIENQQRFSEPEFHKTVESYFADLRSRLNQEEKLLEEAQRLNYEEIGKFTLIDDLPIYQNVFVDWNDESSRLLGRLEEISRMPCRNYEDRLKRRREYRRIKHRIQLYVVSAPRKMVESWNLEEMPYISNMLLLSRDREDFANIYSETTGFTRDLGPSFLIL